MNKIRLKFKRYIAYQRLKKNTKLANQIKLDLKYWDCIGYTCLDCPYNAMPDTCEILKNILVCLENDDRYVTDFLTANDKGCFVGLADKIDLINNIDRESVSIIERKYGTLL